MQLPQGFRFRPTDQELVFDYLLKKVLGQPLPSNAVNEAEVYGCEAQVREAIDQSDGEKFFFVKRRMKNQEGTRMSRSANGVSWKVTGNKKHIPDKSGKLIGIKRSLVFKGNSGYKSLLMDEYELAESIIPKNEVEWVVCRIKESNRSLEISLGSDDMTSPADTMINLEDDWVTQDNSDFFNECLTYIPSD